MITTKPTITSSVKEKLIYAKNRFLDEKRFSPSILNKWFMMVNPEPFIDIKKDESITEEERLLNGLLNLEDITDEQRQRMTAGLELENSISDALQIERQNKDCEALDFEIAKPCIDYIQQVARERQYRRSWIEQQQKLQIIVNAGGIDNIQINGIVDMVWGDFIFDFKRVSSYKYGKYFNNFQHKCYLAWFHENYGDDFIFEYIVSAGKIDPSVFVEQYQWKESYYSDIENCVENICYFLM